MPGRSASDVRRLSATCGTAIPHATRQCGNSDLHPQPSGLLKDSRSLNPQSIVRFPLVSACRRKSIPRNMRIISYPAGLRKGVFCETGDWRGFRGACPHDTRMHMGEMIAYPQPLCQFRVHFAAGSNTPSNEQRSNLKPRQLRSSSSCGGSLSAPCHGPAAAESRSKRQSTKLKFSNGRSAVPRK